MYPHVLVQVHQKKKKKVPAICSPAKNEWLDSVHKKKLSQGGGEEWCVQIDMSGTVRQNPIIPSDCSPTTAGLPVRRSLKSIVRSQSVQKLVD